MENEKEVKEKVKNPVMVMAGHKAAKNRKLNILFADLEYRILAMKSRIQNGARHGNYHYHLRDAKRDVRKKMNEIEEFLSNAA